ncbi:MAG: hypothetical protein ACAH88_10890, partial [Roseimicrobium sp.]
MASPAAAQTTWNNAGSGSWFTSSNWSPAVTPAATTNVTINNGGTAQVTAAGAVARSVVLGAALGQSGNLEITGPGTLVVATSFPAFLVGNFGTGTVTISGGGTLSTTLVSAIGNQIGSFGKVTITGAGSVWNEFSSVDIGSSGEGELHILAGGKFGTTSAATIFVGNDNGAEGIVYVTGNGSNLRVSAANIGAAAGGTGEVQVSGSGAGFTATGTVNVAAAGTSGTGASTSGKLLLDNSATGTFQGLSIGNVAGGTGEVKLQNNAALTVTNAASIGVGGTGTLLISSGADLTSAGGTIGVNGTTGGTQGSGTVSVDGLGSSWLMGSSALRMGESSGNNGTWPGGGASLSVLNGAQVGAGSLTGIHSSTTYGSSSITIGGLGSDGTTRAKLTITNAVILTARAGEFNLN